MKIKNLEEMVLFSERLGSQLESGDVVLLIGDLGTGKTTMTKTIASSLGIKQMIKSPTYTIVREYTEGRLPLYHMDVYRVEFGMEELGLEEYFEGDGVSIVEWGNMLEDLTPDERLEIHIEKTNVEDERKVTLEAFGQRYVALKTLLEKEWADE